MNEPTNDRKPVILSAISKYIIREKEKFKPFNQDIYKTIV